MVKKQIIDTSLERAQKWGDSEFIDNDILLTERIHDAPIPVEPKRMSFTLLALCTKGKAQYSIDTQEQVIKPGDVIIISDRHVVDNYMPSPDLEGLCMMVSRKFYYEIIQSVSDVSLLFLFSMNHPVVSLTAEEAQRFKNYFDIIKKKLSETKHHYRRELVRTLMLAMFYDLSDVIYRELKSIYDAGENFGCLPNKNNVTIQVEYVSANPTGLLHVGHGRGAAAGSAIVNILRAAGYNVESEYYINDAGNQMDKLTISVNARYLELLGQKVDFPEDGYQGVDIIDTTKRIIARDGDKYLNLPESERLKILGELAYEDKMRELKKDLKNFRVKFDVWFSERTLHPDKINAAIETLKEKGGIYEQDGALWLASSKFGDDKDRVVIRENGEPTYLAADIAYHKNKFDRNFGTMINLWGADHHGYIARVKAAMSALGFDADKLKILLLQIRI